MGIRLPARAVEPKESDRKLVNPRVNCSEISGTLEPEIRNNGILSHPDAPQARRTVSIDDRGPELFCCRLIWVLISISRQLRQVAMTLPTSLSLRAQIIKAK